MIDAPTLQTERLTLTAHTIDDVADSTAMWADPDVVRYIGGKPATPEEVWARVCRYAGHWQLVGYGYFAVRERSSGRFVGEAGLADFRRAIEPAFDAGVPEVGWALATWAHGRGFATEAVRAVLGWADTRFACTVCIIDPPNTRSVRVAVKCGFRERHRATYRGEETVVYERTRDDTVAASPIRNS